MTEPLQVKQAPISRPHPDEALPEVKGRPKGRMLLGYVVWGSIGAVIAVIELLAAVKTTWAPWKTLSSTVGQLQDDYSWVGVFVLGTIVVLAMRVLFYPWPFKEAKE